jgi:hypothetical protein
MRFVAMVTACVTLAACGSAATPDVAKIRQTLTRAFHALAGGDGATLCSLATQAGQASLAQAVPHSTCAQVVKLVSAELSPAQKAAMRSAQVGHVTLQGNRATVPETAITSSKGSLRGFLQAGAAPTRLTKQTDGSWKLSG